MPNNKQFLDEKGLERYHAGVINALKDKAAKEHVYVGSVQPIAPNITVWFDTNERLANTSSNNDELVLYGGKNLTETLSLDDSENLREELTLDKENDTLVLDDSENLREELTLED